MKRGGSRKEFGKVSIMQSEDNSEVRLGAEMRYKELPLLLNREQLASCLQLPQRTSVKIKRVVMKKMC